MREEGDSVRRAGGSKGCEDREKSEEKGQKEIETDKHTFLIIKLEQL